MKKLFSIVILTAIFLPGKIFAQGEGGSSQEWLLIGIAGFLIFTIIVLGAIIFSLSSLQKVINQDSARKLRDSGVEVREVESWWSSLYKRLWAVKPLEEESDILMDHDYDGIRELDNHLPPWWTYLFYFTIAFGVVYMVSYHLLETRPLQIEEYNLEMAAAEQEAAIRKATWWMKEVLTNPLLNSRMTRKHWPVVKGYLICNVLHVTEQMEEDQ